MAKEKVVNIMKDFFKKTKDTQFYDLDSLEKTFGPKHFISTGLPSFDLHLDGKYNSVTDRYEFGWPTGRIHEIVGASQTFKSYLMHLFAAQTIKMGGYVWFLTDEMDVNLNFYKTFYESEGLDFEQAKESIGAGVVKTVLDLKDELQKILKYLAANERLIKDQNVPIMIFMDSLGALQSHSDYERTEKGETIKPGSHARELHDLFKSTMYDIARYDVAFFYTNHYRANLGFGHKKQQPAHDFVVQYYPSYRLGVSAWTPQSGRGTSHKRNYEVYQTFAASWIKKRGPTVGENKFELTFYSNHGFSLEDSLVDAILTSGLANAKAKEMIFRDPFSNPSCRFETYYNEFYKSNLLSHSGKVTPDEFKKIFKKDEALPYFDHLAQLCFKIGPIVLKDRRIMSGGSDTGEDDDSST